MEFAIAFNIQQFVLVQVFQLTNHLAIVVLVLTQGGKHTLRSLIHLNSRTQATNSIATKVRLDDRSELYRVDSTLLPPKECLEVLEVI